jgi:pseudaminic acid synthase
VGFAAEVRVENQLIGVEHPPFVVAEMSGNHNGDLDRALAIVDAVAASGAQALKLQTYTADTLTIDVDRPEFRVSDDHGLWGGRTLHQLYREAHTPWEWHEPLFARAREHGLVAFSSPFDPTALELLERCGVALYKTASAEIVDLPLLREVARTGKPILMSTGMASLAEIDAAVSAVQSAGCTELVLLACTASYPADAGDARLGNIQVLREAFGVPVGLSDHTLGVGAALAAVAHGACCLEKHVSLSRSDGGVDSAFSLEPDELALLRRESETAWRATRSGTAFGPTDSEQEVLRLRRSLYVVADVRAGDEVTADNVRSIRPAGGLAPDVLDTVLGRRFTTSVTRGTPLTWDVL